jgi:ADP-dependent NAD(P)H-hydrate dehydratase / NAD(P)H-hydrate epimerase
VRFLSAEESRACDARTIASGTPGLVLMKRAAAAVAREAARAVAARPERAARVVVLAGPGNNGGDGFEAARLLHASRTAAGIETLLLGDPDRLTGDAKATFQRLVQSGLPVRPVGNERDLEALRSATLVVDALFGTGLARPVAPDSLAARACHLASAGRAFVVSVDVPSGLSGDRYDVPVPAVRADVTVTFGTPKHCHVFPPAAGLCGRIVVADIGLLAAEGEPPAGQPEAVVAADVAPFFPPRPASSHKGSWGHLLVAGGADGFRGAPGLAARAAHRSGAGLVTVAAPELVRSAVHMLSPETTTVPPDADLSPYDALAVGPGLGRSEAAAGLLGRLVEWPRPAVFDADALNLAGDAAFFARRGAPTILTPHPGEAGRLLGSDAGAVNADRTGSALRLAQQSGAVVVLKGFRSVVADPSGRTALVLAGNPGMASGGTGDVLTGIAGAFLARGLGAWDAAAAAALLHGIAGDLAAEAVGQEALVASDVTEFLGAAFGVLREARPF